MILDASRFICALLMCLKFQVSKNSQPYTVAAATCSASASAFRGNGPGYTKRFATSSISRVNGKRVRCRYFTSPAQSPLTRAAGGWLAAKAAMDT